MNKDSLERILEHLTTKDLVEHDFCDCLTPGFTIPGLIAHLVNTSDAGDKLSYEVPLCGQDQTNDHRVNQICDALGYDTAAVSSKCMEVSPARRNATVNFDVTGLDSFRKTNKPITRGKTKKRSIAAMDNRFGFSSAITWFPKPHPIVYSQRGGSLSSPSASAAGDFCRSRNRSTAESPRDQ